jgi:hypothetical protein
MRLWSLHPRYLDPQGLVALWREALLARKVLRGETRGYRHHPQLQRFRDTRDPPIAIDAYLAAVHAEATARGYAFDASKFDAAARTATIPVARGQLEHEWSHLMRKLEARNPELHARWRDLQRPRAHPSFRVVAGPVADWERPRDEHH